MAKRIRPQPLRPLLINLIDQVAKARRSPACSPNIDAHLCQIGSALQDALDTLPPADPPQLTPGPPTTDA
jgi:hypothetical protein